MSGGDPQIKRLLSLIPYLVRHQGATLDEVCGAFRISRKELLKDIELIFVCGKPGYDPGDLIDVTIEGDRIYTNMADYFSRPFRFTGGELMFLYLAGRALSDLAGLREAAVFQSALGKLRSALLREEKADLESVSERVVMRPEHPDHPRLQKLRRAIEENRRVEVEYYSTGRDVLTRRRIDPLKLRFSAGNWYLLAWDHLSGERRLFRVDRMRECRVLKAGFNPEDYAGILRSGEALPRQGPFPGKKVRLRFNPVYASWVMEMEIFSEKKREKDGSVLCVLRAENFAWLEKELLRYGTGVEILEPPELREAVLKRVENLLEAYRD